jgi:hypothetical protein
MALTEEQRQRKNEMAKLNRAKKKAPVIEYESESDGAIEDDVKDEVQEVEKVEVEIEDPEIARKKAIADKRRESLTLARSKIKPKSQITKEKDNEIAIMKAENEKLKAENAKVLAVKPKLVKKYVREPEPVRQRPIRQEREVSMDYLADQNYGEQLRERHKHNMYQRMMSDTFM